jgi:AraC-like DNA-binding protein
VATGASAGISAEIVTPVRLVLERLGVNVAELAQPVPDSAGSFVAGSAADALLDRASETLKDEALGITLAEQIPIGALGILDYALSTSSSLGDAMQRVASHYALATDRVRMQVVQDAEGARVSLDRRPGLDHSRHWIEFSLAVIAMRCRQAVGEALTFDGVHFVHASPRSTSRHEAFFRCPIRFEQPQDCLRFPAALLARPLLTASAALADVLDARMRELTPAVAEEDRLLQDVRRAIVEGLDRANVSLEVVLQQVRMSRRTLQRELSRRKTSHKQLLDEVRKERALVLLQRDAKVAEVALQLGFSEPSAFFRAFRRWTGSSPRASLAKAED